MEALSPRSTNQMIRPKPATEHKMTEKHAAAGPVQKSSSSKNHADPPPSLVPEPEDGGERYSIGGFLGKGGFAVCYEGTLARNGRLFAMKVVKSQMPQKKMEEKFRTELQIHSKMRHPFIVQFYRAFAFEQSTYVVLELCPNGSVMDMVKKRRSLTLPEVRRFMIQLCAAVKYLHKRFVAHRDLKMGNLFLDHNMNIKVGDFGLAAMILSDKDAKRRNTLCGTPNYIAPEILDKSKGGHTQKVDIWSLGVIFFAMLTGYPPFQSKTQEEIYKKVRSLTYVWPKESDHSNFIPEEAKDLVSACLNLVDEERPDPDDIVEHPFFNMYDGCIPRQLDPACRFNKPIWLRDQAPRGDSMMAGYGLDSDEKLRSYVYQVDDPGQRYHSCKAAFYSLCGVGRKPDGTARKSVGRNCSKSAYSECEVEDARGLRPMVPLPMDFVYRWPHDVEGDWCLLETSRKQLRPENPSLESSTLSQRSTTSIRSNTNVTASRTNAALAAAHQRRRESQNHAATLRQQARPNTRTLRHIPSVDEVPEASTRPYRDIKEPEAVPAPAPVPAPVPAPAPATAQLPSIEPSAGGLAERPIRTRRMASASNAPTLRETERSVAPQLSKSTSMPSGLTIGKTRSQSRRMATGEAINYPPASTTEHKLAALPEERRTLGRQTTLRATSRSDLRMLAERQRPVPELVPVTSQQSQQVQSTNPSTGIGRSNSKTSSGTKARSSLGLSPLFHHDDLCDLIPGTSLSEVNTDLRLMLANLVNHAPGRRRGSSRKQPHAYVIKWVDYTNRYGIGYVLDDGSVGCVFKGEHGQPSSSVVVRDGERHIRRKARSVDSAEGKGIPYSESEQLVPRHGNAIEFYENKDDDLLGCRGIRKGMVSPSLFDTRNSKVMKIRVSGGSDADRCDAEKIKRVKLVDQFGKYMIGSLGRHGDDGLADAPASRHISGQFIKFYQRLGNVGIWGFGDGAFQFNFPDHTKLVISPGRTRSSSPWIDFYHLSPSAARYFTAKGKMHPSGFDTRAIASDEAATFINIASGISASSVEERIREILEANSFMEKINFMKEVLKGWIKHGRLGGRPPANSTTTGEDSVSSELFWQGTQERTPTGGQGTKFVWVTVGAPDGDGEYRSVMLKDSDRERLERKGAMNGGAMDHEKEMDVLRERLRTMGRE